MNSDELKKKIVETLKKAMEPIEYGGDNEHAPEIHYPTEDEIADALIDAVIEDVREAEYRAEVLRLALSKSVLDENAIFDDDVCRYILSNTKLTEEYYIEQAEKELAEERKDD